MERGMAYREFAASQPGVTFVTGRGGYVWPKDIVGCVHVRIPSDLMFLTNCQKTDLPQDKGKKAVSVAVDMLKRGLVPLPAITKEITDHDMQVKGKDIVVTSRFAVQVKCDFDCGKRGLAIQTHECNPLRRY